MPINRDPILNIKRDHVSSLQPNSQCMDDQKLFSNIFFYHRFSKGSNCYVAHPLKWELLGYFVSLLVPALYIPVDNSCRRRTGGKRVSNTPFLSCGPPAICYVLSAERLSPAR